MMSGFEITKTKAVKKRKLSVECLPGTSWPASAITVMMAALLTGGAFPEIRQKMRRAGEMTSKQNLSF